MGFALHRYSAAQSETCFPILRTLLVQQPMLLVIAGPDPTLVYSVMPRIYTPLRKTRCERSKRQLKLRASEFGYVQRALSHPTVASQYLQKAGQSHCRYLLCVKDKHYQKIRL